MVDDKERRLAYFILGYANLFQLVSACNEKGYLKVQLSGIPADAKLITVRDCTARLCLLALYTHSSFEEVPSGGEIPILGTICVATAGTEFGPPEEAK